MENWFKMQTSHKEDFEEKLEEALQPEGPKDTLSTTSKFHFNL